MPKASGLTLPDPMAGLVQLSAPYGRHALPGRGDLVHASYWVASGALVLALALGIPLGRPAAVAIATLVFIGGGLPHGAYDISLLRRAVRLDQTGVVLAFAGYIAVAAGMALLWLAVPLTALILFLAVAAVHFGEDWQMLDEPLLRVAAGAAIIVAATIGHPAEVGSLFVAMTDPRGAVVAQIVTAAAPVILLVTAVGIAAAWQDGTRQWALAMILCLVLLLVAPPVAGFALFFVFLHSPRHLQHTRTMLPDMTQRRWLITGVSLSGAAIVGWWGLHRLSPYPAMQNWTAPAFQLLASVAVPHLLLSRWVERRLARADRFRQTSAEPGTQSL